LADDIPFMQFKTEDIRTTLPYTLLGFVEALQPTFFLLENVTGLMAFTLRDQNGEKRVNMAAVKLFCRVLMALGYQVRFKVLQAGSYGAPQDRERIIFLGAKRGHKLPDFPTPTHAFKPARQWKIPLRQRDRIRPPTCSRTHDDDHFFASHPTVTVNDAISDLVRLFFYPHDNCSRLSGSPPLNGLESMIYNFFCSPSLQDQPAPCHPRRVERR
jgi:DNA (cytosine-5)-methyltransferase 1